MYVYVSYVACAQNVSFGFIMSSLEMKETVLLIFYCLWVFYILILIFGKIPERAFKAVQPKILVSLSPN